RLRIVAGSGSAARVAERSVRTVREHMFVRTTREKVARLLAQGHSASAIAVQLQLAGATVSYHIERRRTRALESAERSVVPVESVRFQVNTRERVDELLSCGIGRAEIARRLGLT